MIIEIIQINQSFFIIWWFIPPDLLRSTMCSKLIKTIWWCYPSFVRTILTVPQRSKTRHIHPPPRCNQLSSQLSAKVVGSQSWTAPKFTWTWHLFERIGDNTPEKIDMEHLLMELWKIMFLSFHGWFVGSILMFHVNLPGSTDMESRFFWRNVPAV